MGKIKKIGVSTQGGDSPGMNPAILAFTKSKVYFTNLRTKPSINLLKKLENLIIRTGIEQIDFNRKIVALKIHFGEPGNLAYLRPNYAARIVRFLKGKEAVPFLTDCNTLYWGRRSNAPSHLEAAFENGYNPIATGCPVIIADGIKGTDYREIEVNLDLCKSAKIGSAIADSDVVISLNHFKGHELTGFGEHLKTSEWDVHRSAGNYSFTRVHHPGSLKRIAQGAEFVKNIAITERLRLAKTRSLILIMRNARVVVNVLPYASTMLRE